MISPSSSTVNYGDLLRAPEGYSLDFAVGTTYSLDLRALMGAYLSLGLSVDTDSALAEDPMYLFSALQEIKGKVLVFCEKGRVSGASGYRQLYSQLEGSIIQVALGKCEDVRYPSFHPKVWILRFSPKGNDSARYRVCILSRNITLDTSWDLAGSFEGDYEGAGKQASNHSFSLTAFAKTLRKLLGRGAEKNKRDIIDTLCEEIPYVYFKESGNGYNLVLPFSFTGVEGARTFKDDFQNALDASGRVLVMTPFISENCDERNPLARIAEHCEGGEKPVLITRIPSLEGAKGSAEVLSRFSVFSMRSDLVAYASEGSGAYEDAGDQSGSDWGDGEAGRPQRADIHAKLYVFEPAGGKGTCDVFFGSANASMKGHAANCEAMAHLRTRGKTFDSILKDLGLTEEELAQGSLFEPVPPSRLAQLAASNGAEDPARTEMLHFDHFLRDLRVEMRIRRCACGEGFDVAVKAKGSSGFDMGRCEVSIASQSAWRQMGESLTFEGVALRSLTSLVCVKIDEEGLSSRRFVKCDVKEGESFLEEQTGELFRSVTRGRFLDYLMFRLSDNPEYAGSAGSRCGTSLQPGTRAMLADGLYESLLRASVDSPQKAQSIIGDCLSLCDDGPEEGEDAEWQAVRDLLTRFEEAM